MYIRPGYRKKGGKRHAYWYLVESYRTERGPRQRTVAYLGDLDEAGRLGVKATAAGSETGAAGLFESTLPRFVEVEHGLVRVENIRDFGGYWLGLELMRRLGLDGFLRQVLPAGRETIDWDAMAKLLVLCRLLDPSSELYIAEHLYERSGLEYLLGVPASAVDDNRLYRALDQLLPHKAAIEIHLKTRLGTLFDLHYDLVLYDITSTYFEGKAEGNSQARRGYSRGHRPDCKQVCIALSVTREGFPLGYGDYHRVHVPASGRVIGHHLIGGRLLPVTVESYRVFGPVLARNRRRVTIIQAQWGIYALVMVGAFNVGKMPVNYSPPPVSIRVMPVECEPAFDAGDELGRFELGSTVVLLFPAGCVRLEIPADGRVRVGLRIGTVINTESK
ncbi:MAG: phosphatidylserine decarboxylase [Planctomycetota bacterium]